MLHICNYNEASFDRTVTLVKENIKMPDSLTHTYHINVYIKIGHLAFKIGDISGSRGICRIFE